MLGIIMKNIFATFTLLMLLTCSTTMGQTVLDSALVVRYRIAQALNTALGAHSSTASVSPSVVVSVPGVGCDTVSTLPVSIAYVSPSQFQLIGQIASSDTIVSGSVDNELVRRLNAYLDAVWALDLTKFDSGYSRLLANISPCDSPMYVNPYVHLLTEDELEWAPELTQLIHDYIDSVSGRKILIEGEYRINDEWLSGQDFICFDISNSSCDPELFPGYAVVRIIDSAIRFIAPQIKLTFGSTIYRFQPPTPFVKVFPPLAEICPEVNRYQYFDSLGYYGAFEGLIDPVYSQDQPTICTIPALNWIDMFEVLAQPGKFTETIFRFYIDRDGYLCAGYVDSGRCVLSNADHPSGPIPDSIRMVKIVPTVYPAEYCRETFCLGGYFAVDSVRGAIVYFAPTTSGCGSEYNPQPVTCLALCDSFPEPRFCLEGVIRSSAVELSSHEEFDTAGVQIGLDGANSYEKGLDGRWHATANYVYRSPVVKGSRLSDTLHKIYDNAGVFTDPMVIFNWSNLQMNDTLHWLQLDSATWFDRNGAATEQVDVLDIPSAVRFDSLLAAPVMVAQNARYHTINFESFETWHGGGSLSVEKNAHSGMRSMLVPLDPSATPELVAIIVDDRIARNGLLVKFWVRTTYGSAVGDSGYAEPVAVNSVLLGALPTPRRIAQTGAWTLYETGVDSISLADIGEPLALSFSNLTVSDTVWIDDIRIQPREAQATCFVYDLARHRPVASFDDQHFGLFYQYNGEGALVRKLRETERGLRTVEEAQYHTPRTWRNDTTVYAGTRLRPLPTDLVAGIGDDRRRGETLPTSIGEGAKFEALNLTLDGNGEKIRLFGSRPMSWKELKSMKLPQINAMTLPFPQQIRLLEELRGLRTQIEALDQQIDTVSDASRKRTLERSRDGLATRCQQLLKGAGLDPSKLSDLFEEIKEVEATARETVPTNSEVKNEE